MKYSSRFFLYAPLAVFLSLAAWAMAYWWVVAGAIDKKLTALNGHDAIPGVSISYTSKTISGFPFNIDIVFTGLKITGAGPHGPFAWSTENFALHRLTYGRSQDIYEAAGNQTLDWTDGSGKPHTIHFLPGSLRASSITDAKGLARFDLDMVAMDGTDAHSQSITAGHLQLHLRRDPNADALDLVASADSVATPTIQIKNLRYSTTLNHGAALAPLLAGTQSAPDADTAWRNAGGTAAPATDILTALY